MKVKYFGAAAILSIVALGFTFVRGNILPAVTQTPTAEITMVMKEESYEPQNIEIKKGTKVIFKNETSEPRWPASNIHPTHGIYPEFDPKQPVESGQTWSFIFDKVGRWKYHDHLVPLIRGEIIVSPIDR